MCDNSLCHKRTEKQDFFEGESKISTSGEGGEIQNKFTMQDEKHFKKKEIYYD